MPPESLMSKEDEVDDGVADMLMCGLWCMLL